MWCEVLLEHWNGEWAGFTSYFIKRLFLFVTTPFVASRDIGKKIPVVFVIDDKVGTQITNL